MGFNSPLAHRSETAVWPRSVHTSTQPGPYCCLVRKVEALSSGRYKVRFRHGKRQTSETFDRKRDADQFAAWLDALGPQGALDMLYESEQDKAVPTMSELAADHIAHLVNAEPGTRLNYERLWSRTWEPHIGTTRAHRLTEDAIKRALIDLGHRYSRKSLENQRGLLAGVLDRAVKQRHVTENVAKGLKLPAGQPSRGSDEMRVLTLAEFAALEEAMDEHYRPLIRFLWGTGCRWGEAVALPVSSVRLPNVHIRQALKWSPDNERRIGAPKTKKSRRTIALPAAIQDDMARLCEDKGQADLVFTAKRGGPVLHRTFWSRYWLPAIAGIADPKPRIHDLRHGHASHLLANGVPIHIVQARLGHESIKTTVDTYSHLLPDAQRMAQEAAALAFVTRSVEAPQQVLPLPAPEVFEADLDHVEADT
jgi:integrase